LTCLAEDGPAARLERGELAHRETGGASYYQPTGTGVASVLDLVENCYQAAAALAEGKSAAQCTAGHRRELRSTLRVVVGDVRLTPVQEATLEPLLSVAVAEADPDEVMPPVSGPPGWSQARREAFREFYRSNYDGLDGPTRTRMYAIVCDGNVVGMIRMARRDEPDTVETGMWLGQSARGQGIGVAALRLLLAEAARAGVRRVVAETTSSNTPALGVMRRCGAVVRDDGSAVRAEMLLERD
jgi:RimJ/RimL family protein N-acetyltransferase